MQVIYRRKFLCSITTSFFAAFLLHPIKQLFANVDTEEKLPSWNELVEVARWCPSVHNLQPHKIKIISATEAELYYDPARLLPVGDPQCIFSTVAMGIFIEHLSIVAASYKQKITIAEVFDPIKSNATSLQLFARLQLVTNDVQEELTKDLITKRRTSRIHYDGKILRQETLNRIKTQAEEFDHNFFYSNEKELIDLIIQLNQETLFEDLSSKADREELDHLFRYTKEEAEEKKDGLWAKCMGFPGSLVKSVFLHHQRWEKGLRHKVLAKHYKNSFKGTATLCWFAGKFNNTNDWLIAGKMMARNWLTLTKDNAYIQPFGSLITNVKAYKKINEKLTGSTDEKKIWMLFRAGYSSEPARSYRLSTNEILI